MEQGSHLLDVRVGGSRRMRGVVAVEATFWVAAGLLVYAQVGYPVLLEVLARLRPPGGGGARGGGAAPRAG
jgi:hypothetical protein